MAYLQPITSLPRKSVVDWYLDFLAVVLLGYALFNRGFAYVGVHPVFLGEVALVAGLFFCSLRPIFSPIFKFSSAWLLVLLIVWVSLRTATEIGFYGFDSIRDAMIVGYGLFAFIIASLILAKPPRLVQLLERYRQFCYLFLILTPLIRLLVILWGGEANLPFVPGSTVPIICLRMGPVMVHLATITIFLSTRRPTWIAVALISLNFLLAITSRGGALAFIATMGALLILRPMTRLIWHLAGLAMLSLALLGFTGIEIQLDAAHAHRNISFDMVTEQFTSIVKTSDVGSFDDNKKWRIDWWNHIVSYTVFGDYFLTGKGFGVNLAKDDGIPQGDDEQGALRSPHNSHLTMLARGGVPAFLLWVAFNASWAIVLFLYFRLAARRRDAAWANLFLLLLGHWLAATVSTSFDVYLEGPMGGIWFWLVIGIGWAAAWLYRRRPQLLGATADLLVRGAPQPPVSRPSHLACSNHERRSGGPAAHQPGSDPLSVRDTSGRSFQA
jgi:hypothetical protein